MEVLGYIMLLLTVCKTVAEVGILTTAPVNPVKTGGILSTHCRVNGLEQGQSITMSRQLKGSSQTERISWDAVLTVPDERIFLAVRQLEDGSLVYFLSVLQVTRADEGVYFCTAASDFQKLAEQSVDIEVQRFPDDPYPECFPPENLRVEIGGLVTMGCLSGTGVPTVDMVWKRTGSGKLTAMSQEEIQNDTIRSVLQFRATRHDNGAMFLCEISSSAFTEDNKKTCHIGPLVVTDNGQVVTTKVPSIPLIPQTPRLIIKAKTNHVPTKPIRNTHEPCQCSLLEGPQFYWIIATVFAGVLAFIIFVVIIIFSIKLHRKTLGEHQQTVSTFITPYPPTDDAYEQLEYKRNNNKTYMELQKKYLQKNAVSMDVECQGQYVITPSQPQ